MGKTLPISHEPYANVDRLQVTVISNSNRRKRRLGKSLPKVLDERKPACPRQALRWPF